MNEECGYEYIPNDEDVRMAGMILEYGLSLRKNEDYVVNQPQMVKLIEAKKFFNEISKKNGGRVEPLNFEPKEEVGCVSASVKRLDLTSDECKKFADIISTSSAFGFDTDIYRNLRFDITIPEVYVLK